MKRSILADEIVSEWHRENYFKRKAKRNKKFKCKIDGKMQCDKCQYSENCLDKE